MVFDPREKAKKYTPSEGDTLEKIAQRERDAGNDITWEDIAKFNWGTADKATVNEYLRDELGARLRDADNNFVISADDQPSGELLIPTRYKNNSVTTNKRIVLHVGKQPPPPKQFLECAAIPGVTFEFDKSFVRPSVVDHLAALKEAISKHPKAKFVIFGHTDKVGDELYNKKLSERRAKSVYAFIVNDVEIWEQLYKAENWGIKAVQEILRDMGGAYDPGAVDGKTGPKTEAAIKQYQKDRGLPVDGIAGPNTRKKLFADYMSGKHDIKLTAGDFVEPKQIGCGEFNPVVETEEANEANRRVVFYLFDEKRPPRFPCSAGNLGPCKKQAVEPNSRHRKTFNCSFYDSIARQCPSDGSGSAAIGPNWIDVEYLYADGTPVVNANYKVRAKTGPEILATGAIGKNGKSRAALPAAATEVLVEFYHAPDLTNDKIVIQPRANEEHNKPKNAGWFDRMQNSVKNGAEWAWGTLQGDFNEDPTVGQIFTNMAVTMIPVIDQIGDARDLAANLKKLIWDKRYNEYLVWVALFLSAIGCIPELGSLLKGVFKYLLKSGKTAVPKQFFEIFNYFAKGNAVKWLKNLDINDIAKQAEKTIRAILDSLGEKLATLSKNSPKWLDSTRRALDDAVQAVSESKKALSGMLDRFTKEMEDLRKGLLEKIGKESPQSSGHAKGAVVTKQSKASDKEIAKVSESIDSTPGVNGAKNAETKSPLTKGEPVSVVTGTELIVIEDFALPGFIPFAWTRKYDSSQSAADFGMGYGWLYPGCETLFINRNTVEFQDGDGRMISFPKPAPGRQINNTLEKLRLYHSKDGIYLLTRADGTTLLFDAGQHVSRIKERRNRYGKSITYTRDSLGRLTLIQDSVGRAIRVIATSEGRIRSLHLLDAQRNPVLPALVSYEYDALGNLERAQDEMAAAESYAYRNHVIVERVFKSGFRFFFEWDRYDHLGRCIHTTGEQGIYSNRLVYDEANKTTQVTDARGFVSTFRYNDRGQVVEEVDAAGALTRTEYDGDGNLRAVIDPLGVTTRYYHDASGNLIRLENAAGAVTSIIYDLNDNPVEITDPLGNIWTRRYDDKNNLIAITDPLGNSTRYEYSAHGLLRKVIDAAEGEQTFFWDEKAQLIARADALGNKTAFVYDARGRIVTVTDATNNNTTYEYDAKGRVICVTAADGGKTRLEYDAADNLTCLTDTANRKTRYRYTGLSQPAERIDPAGRSMRYLYDAERNLTELINPNGEAYRFRYDQQEHIVGETGFDGRTLNYEYDSAGRLVRSTDAGTSSTEFIRDVLGRLTTKRSADGTTTDFGYDPLGRLDYAANRDATLRYSYDAAGRLAHEEQNGSVLRYSYTRNGVPDAITLPDGNTIRYGFDRNGSFRELRYNSESLVNVERDKLGRECTTKFGNAITTESEYDPMGRLVSQRTGTREKTLQHRRYQIDRAGNIVKISDLLKGTTGFNYDALDRIQNITGPESDLFAFDPAGNLLDATNLPTGGYVQGNRLRVYQDFRFEYDAAGNIVEERKGRRTTRYRYNGDNQLLEVEREGQTFRYAYDPFGRRIQKSDAFGTTEFFWLGDVLLHETRNNLKTTYLHEPGTFSPLCKIDNGAVHYYHLDHLGTPQELTDAHGEIVWNVRYRAYGNVVKYEVEEVENNLRFPGQYFDAETGLHYNRHRYYHPVIGRFIHQDPIGLAGGTNLYEYAPNPVGWVDPLGLSCKEVPSGGAVIGRMDDLNAPGALRPGERKIADLLPDQGNAKANYYQNMSVLRNEMRSGVPIRDVSGPDSMLAPTKLNPNRTIRQTFTGAERNQLRNKGWVFDGEYWNPQAR